MDDIYDDDDMEMEEELLLLDDMGGDDDDTEDNVDEVLEMMMGETTFGEDEDMSERRPKRGRSKRRRRGQGRGVRTAPKGSSYRRPVPKKYVTHAEFKKTTDIQDRKIARNGTGIKTVNSRVNGLKGRVDGVVTVNTAQSRYIRKLNKQMKIDAALEFAESYDGTSIDIYQILKGAVKSGMLDSTKGAFSNPLLVGGLGFLLRNPGFLGQLTAGQAPIAVVNP